MITAEHIIAAYARNLALLKPQVDGVSHAESLAQPPVPGNCMNWVIGHILAYRNRVLRILGQAPVFDEVTAARYARDSKPVKGDEPGIGIFEDMLEDLQASQDVVAAGIRALTPEAAQVTHTYGQNTLSAAEWMLFLMRHESYHVGNLEMLREVVLAQRAGQ